MIAIGARAVDDLGDLEPPGKPFPVAIDQRLDRRIAGSTDREDGESRVAADAQPASAAARAGGATDQSRSRS